MLCPIVQRVLGEDMLDRGRIRVRVARPTGRIFFEPGQDVLDQLLALPSGVHAQQGEVVSELAVVHVNGFQALEERREIGRSPIENGFGRLVIGGLQRVGI